MTNTDIVQNVATNFNSNYSSVLSGLLDNITGLTSTEKDNILNGIVDKQPLLDIDSTEDNLSIDVVVNEQTTKAKEMVEENNLLIVETVKKAQEKSIIDNYSPQEAKTGFTVSEVKVSSKVPTTDQIDYMYSPNKLQNILKVVIDTARNIFSKNKLTGQIDMIHGKSGSYLRIDGDGNITEYVTGDYKRVIVGNYTEEIRGSKAVKVKGDNYLTVQGKNEQDVTATNKEQSGASTVIKGSTIHLN